MSGPEAKLQKKIRKKLLEEVGGWWIKIHGAPYQKRGLPDLHGIVEGLGIWIEVKVPSKEKEGLTKLQEQCIEDIVEEGGGLSFVTSSPEHSVETVRKYLSQKRPRR